MRNIFSTIRAESLKIRRSKMLWITILIFLFIPFMMGGLIFIAKDPEMAQKFFGIGNKIVMLNFGDVDWSKYLGLLTKAIVGIGALGVGFITSWIFGREYSDKTVTDLLASPTPRSSIALSKFIVVAIWCVLLSFILFAFGLIVGRTFLQLPGWSSEVALHGVYIFSMASFFTILLCTPVAFFASCGRGYLLPIFFVILTVFLVEFINELSLVNFKPYVPWAIPDIYATSVGTGGMQLGAVSYIILFLTIIFGLIGTLARWRYADQY